MKDVLTVAEFAKIFGVSRETVTNWIRVGLVNGLNVRPNAKLRQRFLIHRAEVERLFEREGTAAKKALPSSPRHSAKPNLPPLEKKILS
jgi:predicted site-specific integrase-resolvase